MCLESFFLKEKLRDYKPSEVHCIQYVGDNPNINVTKLADAFHMTTGGVIKLTKKLMERGLLSKHRTLENKKEVYFTLTEKGKEIYNIHCKLNEQFEQRDREVFNSITDEMYESIKSFFSLYVKHLESEMEKVVIDTSFDMINRL